jgi:hypothetical protein
MAASDAKQFPVKNTAFRVTFPIYDNTGALVSGAAGLDSEVSIDGGTFADCTNEATEIATASGIYYLDLTAGEMNGDTIAILVKTSTTDAKTSVLIFYPTVLSVAALGTNTVSIASGAITAAAIATDAIDGDAIAASAVTEIQSGLATAAALTTVDTMVDAIQAKTDNLPADPAGVSDIPTAVQNADAWTARNVAGGSSTGRTNGEAMAFLRNRWENSANTLTVYDVDDTTVLWTGTVIPDPTGQPIVGLNPS